MKKIKIAHLADVHVRPHKYMDEMKFTFDKFLESIQKNDVNLVVICGDFFHSKLTVSSEYFQTAFSFFSDVADLCPSIVIPGNHDSVLSNQGRLDAITPIVGAVNDSNRKNRIWYITKSDSVSAVDEIGIENSPNIVFHHFSIYDQKEKWPKRELLDPKNINIALYHGCIESCILDNGWVSRGNRDTISIFDGFDYAFLGDIHKGQFLNNDRTIAYPGSLRQNNFGEDMEKGYLLWNIFDKDDFEVNKITLPQKRYFITIPLSSISELDGLPKYQKDSRIRVKSLKQFDLAEEIEIKKELVNKYEPHGEIIFLPPDEKVENTNIKVGNLDIIHDNIRDIEIQKQLIKEYLKKKNIEEGVVDKIIELDKKFHAFIDTDVLRNITYEIKSMKFDNIFSYGKDNKIDFSKYNGLVGIFGPNGVGKSSLFDILCFSLQNSVFKDGANKNGDYINKKCKKAETKLEIVLNASNFIIERDIKKIYSEGKNEPKIENGVNFYSLPKTKNSSLNGETIPDTNKNIRDLFGQKEDLEITSYSPQFDLTSFLDARGTKRKEVLSKFFDLNVFDIKYSKALEEHKEIKSKLKSCNKAQLMLEVSNLEKEVEKLLDEKELSLKEIEKIESEIVKLDEEIVDLAKNKIPVPVLNKNPTESLFELEEKYKSIIEMDNESLLDLKKTFSVLRNKRERVYKAKFKLQVLNQKSNLIEKIPNEDVCKRCSLVADAFASQKEAEEVEREIKELNFDQEAFDKIESRLAQYEKDILLKNEISKKIENIKKYFENKIQIEKNEEIERKIKELKNQKLNFTKNVNELREKTSLIEQKTGFSLAKLESANSKIDLEGDLSKQDEIYSLYLECMGKDGISYWIISKKLILINKIVNQIISQAVNYKFVIEDNDEEKSVKMFILDNGSKIPIELCSGGEKTIIALALRAALWEISLLPKTPILILDESLSFLDNEKYDSTIKIIKYLSSKYFKKIFLITHNEELKAMVDDSIYINKLKSGFSSLETNK